MGRAGGRNNPTRRGGTGDPGPGSPAGKEIGESARQDPDGNWLNAETGNILNYETPRQPVPAPEPLPLFRGMQAHGVPPEDDTTEERASAMRGGDEVRKAGWDKPAPEHVRPVPVPVYVTNPASGSRPLTTLSTNKFTIAASGQSSTRICGRDETRLTMYVRIESPLTVNGSNPAPSQPAVPATGVAQQNVNSYPVSVAIAANGATITNVVVNGVSVGTAAGTYTVPAFGAISISYTVATPTWVWSYAGPQVTTTPLGVRIDHEVSELETGNGALIPVGIGYQELKGCQDELFAVSADSNTPVLSIIYMYELAGAL